jgi:hypothetical protein
MFEARETTRSAYRRAAVANSSANFRLISQHRLVIPPPHPASS